MANAGIPSGQRQILGGHPTLKPTVQEHEVTNQPQGGGSWNPKMGNPVGPK